MRTIDILTTLKAEVERQSMYANTDGEPDSDTSCDAAHWLQKAVDEIESLRAENKKLTEENIELSIENKCAFGWAYGAGRVSKTDDVKGARELYESGLNGAGR